MKKIFYCLGKWHCKIGMRPIFKFQSYLDGYSWQYEYEQKMDYFF